VDERRAHPRANGRSRVGPKGCAKLAGTSFLPLSSKPGGGGSGGREGTAGMAGLTLSKSFFRPSAVGVCDVLPNFHRGPVFGVNVTRMNVHKNARSCPLSRALLVKRVCEQGWSVRAASEGVGMSDRRAREWLRRADADEPLTDRSSRPHSTVSIEPARRTRIVALRRQWLTVRQIAKVVGVSPSTAARVSEPVNEFETRATI
jgi:transposase